jgi:hypothetical protein
MNPSFFRQEALFFIPITEYKIKLDLDQRLNHGFNDIPFFPTWKEFLERSQGHLPEYPNYMTYLLCRSVNLEIIGLIAVQINTYDNLKSKVQVLLPEIHKYLYLSWIAVDVRYRAYNYFTQLFDFYHSLIRRLRTELKENVEGAAIVIRRMRPVIWSLFNCDESCPSTINAVIKKESRRFSFIIKPNEIFNQALKPSQDHMLILFDPPNKIKNMG